MRERRVFGETFRYLHYIKTIVKVGEKVCADLTRKHRCETLVIAALLHVGGPELAFDSPALDDRHFQDVVVSELRPELGIGELDSRLLRSRHHLEEENGHEDGHQPESPGPGDSGHLGAVVRRSNRILFSHMWITPQAASEFSPTFTNVPI